MSVTRIKGKVNEVFIYLKILYIHGENDNEKTTFVNTPHLFKYPHKCYLYVHNTL
jgi:hypothetical protein